MAGTRTEPLMTPQDVADYIAMSKETVYRLAREGLPYLRIRGSMRFKKSDVDRYLAASRQA